MKDVNDLMQAILEMDAAQRKASEKAKAERTARLPPWMPEARRSLPSATPKPRRMPKLPPKQPTTPTPRPAPP